MSTTGELEAEIIDYGQRRKLEKLEKLVEGTDTEMLVSIVRSKIGRAEAASIWNFILMGFSSSEIGKEKRFSVVIAILHHLNKIELSTKRSFDLITRLFIDLPKFSGAQLVEMIEYCIDSIRMGDAKCVAWKDLLPELITILNSMPTVPVNGINMSGEEFRCKVVDNLCTLKWPTPILTPISSMFKEMPITKEEKVVILGKICENMQDLEPLELPPLAFQLFSLCTTPFLVMIPLFRFDRFFYKYHYKKVYAEIDSDITDLNSIDRFSDKEMREAEETILFHLANCTEYKITERDMVTFLKTLSATPQYFLTPFMISAALTMSNVNRYPDSSRLATSLIIAFLKTVIKNNETEKALSKESAWCRDVLNKTVNLTQIFEILIDQGKEGGDVVTPGLVGLSFALLKTKNPSLVHSLAIGFLQKFVKSRFIFGQGVVKNLSNFMFANQDMPQFSECLTTLSLSNTLTVSECVQTIKTIISNLLIIPGEKGMKMMSFLFPIIKISHILRDEFVDMLRKAIYQKKLDTQRMSVFGFCMFLKQIRNNNTARSNSSTSSMSQSSISGLSLMSQATMGRSDNPQRHFDLFTLEIVGILRKCLTENIEIKEILYEGLTRAVDFNPKLTPHILQFIDWHFRSYFVIDQLNFEIKFDKVTRENFGKIEITEDLGRLVQFIGFCIVHCDRHDVIHDNSVLRKLFDSLINRIDVLTLEQLGIIGTLDQKMNIIGCQYLNTIEALMSYAIWTVNNDNRHTSKVLKLFKHHNACSEAIAAMKSTKKTNTKKGKTAADTCTPNITTSQGLTIEDAFAKVVTFRPVNCWEFETLHRFLQIIFENEVSYVSSEQANTLRVNREFVRYVLQATGEHIRLLCTKPEFWHIKYSQRVFENLCQSTRIVYEFGIKKLNELYAEFDTITAELVVVCFKQALMTGDELFRRKFKQFLGKLITEEPNNIGENIESISKVIQDKITLSLDDESPLTDETDSHKIPANLFLCLEIIYSHLDATDPRAHAVSDWLFDFCVANTVQAKSLGVVHKILFAQRVKTTSSLFFNTIAMLIAKELGQIEEEHLKPDFTLKSITPSTIDSCVMCLCSNLKSQIDDVGYVITKAKSYHAKIRITGDRSADECIQEMKSIERAICVQLIHLGNTILPLTNAQISLGQCMDGLIRVLVQYYTCLTNLTKHLMLRHATIAVVPNQSKYDQVIRVAGKPLAGRIYRLITFIEENIFDNAKVNKIDAKVAKAKVLRETRLIPKLVLSIENFNKFVIVWSKKTKIDLAKYLHMGTVRDFRIKTSELRDAITKVRKHNEYDIDESMGRDEDGDGSGDDDAQLAIDESDGTTSPSVLAESASSTSSGRRSPRSKILKNMAKITEKKRKRSDSDEQRPAVRKSVRNRSKKTELLDE